jgi:hypothetical protein
MAQLTRDEFIVELTNRGHGRFDNASLVRYLDWALQDVYRLGKFDTVQDLQTSAALADGDSAIPFTAVATGASVVHAINGVYLKNPAGSIIPLTESSRESFWDTIYPNSLATTKSKQQPSQYYVYGEQVWLYPASDGVYTWYVHYTARADTFAGATAKSGLPERMDTAILAAAEMQCCKRSRDVNGFALAETVLNDLINGEVGNENRQFTEEAPRIGRYEH